MRVGAPMNVMMPIPHRGVFPSYADGAEPADPFDLHTPLDWQEDCSDSAEGFAVEQMHRYEALGYVVGFSSWSHLCDAVGPSPVLSIARVLTKVKNGRTKLRLIIDAKASGVTAASIQSERVLLPRGCDL
eukprot:6482533-Amphidinium_carterae.1